MDKIHMCGTDMNLVVDSAQVAGVALKIDDDGQMPNVWLESPFHMVKKVTCRFEPLNEHQPIEIWWLNRSAIRSSHEGNGQLHGPLNSLWTIELVGIFGQVSFSLDKLAAELQEYDSALAQCFASDLMTGYVSLRKRNGDGRLDLQLSSYEPGLGNQSNGYTILRTLSFTGLESYCAAQELMTAEMKSASSGDALKAALAKYNSLVVEDTAATM